MGVIDQLSAQLKGDEGIRLRPYKDTVGKTSIGIGRNLDDVGISMGEAEQMLWNDINIALTQLKVELPWTQQLSEARLGVLANMTFNLGMPTLLLFGNMLAALKVGNYEGAAQEMANSKWAKQVGPRAQRLIKQMRLDSWQFAPGISTPQV